LQATEMGAFYSLITNLQATEMGAFSRGVSVADVC
jgi:hypothetical protein